MQMAILCVFSRLCVIQVWNVCTMPSPIEVDDNSVVFYFVVNQVGQTNLDVVSVAGPRWNNARFFLS